MKKLLALFLVLSFAFSASATLQRDILPTKSSSFSFSLKGKTGTTNLDNIELNGLVFVYLYNHYHVLVKALPMKADKKGKQYTADYGNELITFSPKKSSYTYKASNVNGSFTLGTVKSDGKMAYNATVYGKGKASAKGVLEEDGQTMANYFDEGWYFGFMQDGSEQEDIGLVDSGTALIGTFGEASGKAGKSYKFSRKGPGNTSFKLSINVKKQTISMTYKTSYVVHPMKQKDI